jgi:hypothetical protein
MSGRKGAEAAVWFVIVVIIGLMIFFVASRGILFSQGGLGVIQEAQGEVLGRATNDFAKVCQDWQNSDKKQEPSYILGGWFSSSVPSAAKSFGTAMNCCAVTLKKDAEDLKSKGSIFSPGIPEWASWTKCYGACTKVIEVKRACQLDPTAGAENSPEFITCLTNGMNGYACS